MSTNKKLQKIQDVWDKITKDWKEKAKNERKDAKKRVKVTTIFAGNSSGKTRLSKHICDLYDERGLPYFNAYVVDLFSWDNDASVLKFDKERIEFVRKFIDKGDLYGIGRNFSRIINLNITPTIDVENEKIAFTYNSTGNRDDEKFQPESISQNEQTKLDSKIVSNGEVEKNDSDTEENNKIAKDFVTENESESDVDSGRIKISKGEESVFIWSIFYTILVELIIELNKEPTDSSESDTPLYIVIDDPVSSMDDKRIISIALELGELISRSNGNLEFIITTHHALFYNVLLNYRGGWNRKNYVLTKSENEYFLDDLGNKDPFAYHHHIIEGIKKAIKDEKIEKHHFNQFRTILEKTANFLRCDNWRKLLPESEGKNEFVKMLNQFSHDRLSELEPKDLSPDEKKKFEQVFDDFIGKFEWYKHD